MKEKSLREFRQEIDKVDFEIIFLLHRRLSIAKQIGLLKKSEHLPIVQKIRQMHVLNGRKKIAKNLNLDPKFIAQLFSLIINESCKIQK